MLNLRRAILATEPIGANLTRDRLDALLRVEQHVERLEEENRRLEGLLSARISLLTASPSDDADYVTVELSKMDPDGD